MNAGKGTMKPNLFDYLAGALLTNGIVWMWTMALNYLITVMPSVNLDILVILTFIVFIGGSAATSYLVCRKTDSGHLNVGLKLALVDFLFSITFMLSMAEPSVGLLVTLLICFFAGSILGAYLALKTRLRRPPKKIEPPDVDEGSSQKLN